MGRTSNIELERRKAFHLQRLPWANQMTAVGIQTLLAFSALGSPELPDEATQAAAVYLARHGLLAEHWGQYRITDKGKAHVAALVALPFPVAKTVWTTPCAKEEAA